MSDADQIIQKIADFLSVSPQDIDKSANLREDLELGPLQLNDLLSSLSHEFNISIDPEDIDDLETVDDLVVVIEDNML
jgi:acyl carrier protein